MSYRDNIDREDRRSQQEQAARVIYERLSKLSPEAARRWFWELLQNARDVADVERGVRVRIALGEDETLTFSHDAGPFLSRDLVSLVKQVPNKRGDEPEGRPRSVGHFGTGFLTTHLLARVADLEGVAADPGELPRRFKIRLDRSGDTEDELRRGVEKAFEDLHALDTLPAIAGHQPGGFDTAFHYRLDENGIKHAHQGLDDLHRLLPFTLAFNPLVRSVQVIAEGVTYAVRSRTLLPGDLERVDVVRSANGEEEVSTLLLTKDQDLTLALPARIDGETVTLLDLPDGTPRLFCAFPLIGTETLRLPFVVNAPHFHPTEPRDGILLAGADALTLVKPRSDENKKILGQITPLFKRFLAASVSGTWNRAFVLAGIGTAPKTAWLKDPNWYAANVVEPLRQAALTAELVTTAEGARKAVTNTLGQQLVRFPTGADEEARATLWELALPLFPQSLPGKEEVEAWRERLWTDRYDVTPAHLVLAAAVGNLDALAQKLATDQAGALTWLNRLVALLRERGGSRYFDPFKETFWWTSQSGQLQKIEWTASKHPILPNQHGRFCFASDLHLDDELDETLKDIAAGLGEDVRAMLLHADVDLGNPKHKTLTTEGLAQIITKRAYERIQSSDADARDAFATLLRWFDDHPADAEQLFGRLYHDQHLLQTAQEAREIRRRAQEAEAAQVERDRLADENATLRDELASLREQLEAAKTAASSTDQSVPSAGEARQLAHHYVEVWTAVKAALGQIGTPAASLTARDLQRLMDDHPALFEHLSAASIEKYLAWLAMVERAKREVRRKLDAMGYDTEAWREIPDFPTIVEGVRRRGVKAEKWHPPHEITLVIRPSDGGFIVLYDEEEKAILQAPDTELWIEGDGDGPERFTIGTLADRLGINRLPVREGAGQPVPLHLS